MVNSCPLFEDGNIAAFRKRDEDKSIVSRLFIVLGKLRSKPSCFHAHDRIVVGVVAVIAIKHLYSEYVFLELIWLPLKDLLDSKTQETAQALRMTELWTCEDPSELEPG